jgi:hypothetical protein
LGPCRGREAGCAELELGTGCWRTRCCVNAGELLCNYGVADWALACPAAARLCFWWLLGAAGRRAERLSPRARYVPWLLFLAVPCLGRCNDLQAGALPRSSRAVHDRGASFLSFSFFLSFFIVVNRFLLTLLPLLLRLSRFHARPVSYPMCSFEGSSHLLESQLFLGFCDLRVLEAWLVVEWGTHKN